MKKTLSIFLIAVMLATSAHGWNAQDMGNGIMGGVVGASKKANFGQAQTQNFDWILGVVAIVITITGAAVTGAAAAGTAKYEKQTPKQIAQNKAYHQPSYMPFGTGRNFAKKLRNPYYSPIDEMRLPPNIRNTIKGMNTRQLAKFGLKRTAGGFAMMRFSGKGFSKMGASVMGKINKGGFGR